MQVDLSYGVIPLQRRGDAWMVLLVRHREGHWSFPKGHPETGETPFETAARELREETGLSVRTLLSAEPLTERYTFSINGVSVAKTVSYYLAEVEGDVSVQEDEISSYSWDPLETAMTRITFSEARRLLSQVKQFLNSTSGNPG